MAFGKGHVLHSELAPEAVIDAAPVGFHHGLIGQFGVRVVPASCLATDLFAGLFAPLLMAKPSVYPGIGIGR